MQMHWVNESLTLCVCAFVCVSETTQMHVCVNEKSQRERLFERLDRVQWIINHFYFLSMNHVTIWPVHLFNLQHVMRMKMRDEQIWNQADSWLLGGCLCQGPGHLWKTLLPLPRVSSSLPHAVETLVTITICYWWQIIIHMSLCVLLISTLILTCFFLLLFITTWWWWWWLSLMFFFFIFFLYS